MSTSYTDNNNNSNKNLTNAVELPMMSSPCQCLQWVGLLSAHSGDKAKDAERERKMKRFWVLNFAVALPLGMIQAWASVLDLNLEVRVLLPLSLSPPLSLSLSSLD